MTDGDRPRRLGPKRATYIRKIFALRKDKDDVRKYVVKREIKRKDKTFFKAPRIQRLVTEKRLRRKKLFKKVKLDNLKKGRDARAKYEKLLSQYIKEKKSLQEAAKKEKAGDEAHVEPKKVESAKKDSPKKSGQAQAPAKQDPKKADAPKKQEPKKADAPKVEPKK